MEDERFREAVIREEVREGHRGLPANDDDLEDGEPVAKKKERK
jgi:hypothetical protein